MLKVEQSLETSLQGFQREVGLGETNGFVRNITTPKLKAADQEAIIGFAEGKALLTLHATDPHEVPRGSGWPDLLFLRNSQLGEPGQKLYRWVDMIQSGQVEAQSVSGKLTRVIDDCLIFALQAWNVQECELPPILKHQFVKRNGGFLAAHIDQFPHVYEKFLPGIGGDFECFNIWVLLDDGGYNWNPVAFLHPGKSDMRKVLKDHSKSDEIRMGWPQEPNEHHWVYWPEMRKGDVIFWRSRAIYHGGAVIPKLETEHKRRSFDLRRLVGTKGWVRKHSGMLQNCHEKAGIEFELY